MNSLTSSTPEFLHFYITFFLLTAILLLIAVNLKRLATGKKIKWSEFSFSVLNYHIFFIPLVAPFLVWFAIYQDIIPLYLFAAYAVAGVIGETIFGFYWDTLIDKRFWVYSADAITKKAYSSWLNLLAWGLGGFLYVSVARAFSYEPTFSELATFWSVLLGSAVLIIIIRWLLRFANSEVRNIEFKKMNILSYSVAILPIIVAVLSVWYFHSDKSILLIAVFFGLIAFFVEYVFGKMCEKFLSKRLWTYTYRAHDRGHLTLLAIIPFALGGFLFLTVYYLSLLFI